MVLSAAPKVIGTLRNKMWYVGSYVALDTTNIILHGALQNNGINVLKKPVFSQKCSDTSIFNLSMKILTGIEDLPSTLFSY